MVTPRCKPALYARLASLALVFVLSACSRALVVHIPQPADWSMGSKVHTASLTVSDAQALNIGGTTLELLDSACPRDAAPGDIRVCLHGSRACEQLADKPAVAGVTLLYRCITPAPRSNSGLGTALPTDGPHAPVP